MKKRILAYSVVMTALVLTAPAAFSWGPRGQVTVVNTALHLVSREQNLPLTRLQDDIRAGATLSPPALEELYPDLANDPLRAIENEMALLKAARGVKVDGYYAFRLGALGKLVSQFSAPMSLAEPVTRSLYYNDAEQAVDSGSLKPAPRKVFENMQQLERIMREANASNDLIENDYKSGRGFQGSAAARLAEDVSRSVNTVADVWWSIMTSNTLQGNISENQLQQYVLKAYTYYVDQNSMANVEAADKNYEKLVEYTPDMRVNMGDLFHGAGFLERAIREYEAALTAAPGRRDVVEKIGNYYSDLAEKSLEKGLLEEALAGFQKAIDINGLHPTAEKRRLEVAALIKSRDEQQAQYQAALAQAEELRSLAEEEASKNRYAEAVALLQQSESALGTVGEEFPLETQKRVRAERDIKARISELQQLLLGNTASFSGTGFAPDTGVLIQEAAQGTEAEALKALLSHAFAQEMGKLKAKMQAVASLD